MRPTMFTFPIMAVREVIARGETDAVANGGFRNPYYGTRPGEGEKPGLWLVRDEGVYIISNGKLTEGQKPLVVYSNECHPHSTMAAINAITNDLGHAERSHSSIADRLTLQYRQDNEIMAALVRVLVGF
jgi:hypothetical protein